MRHSGYYITVFAIITAAILSGCASGSSQQSSLSEDDMVMMFGRAPKDLDVRLAEAAKHPLGSKENPIRADDPIGERDYLRRLRCQNNSMPTFERTGNYGTGVFGHIIDGYQVECAGSEPAKTLIFMDMYFHGYVENQAPEGFTLVQ